MQRKEAYTLMELAVVFTVIGMLIGGSLYGSYLVQTANLRSVIVDFKTIETAFQGFIDTYQAVPGDFVNAGNIWGTRCNPTPANCNGNGDGLITANSSATANEMFRSWQHLALSGFYPNNLTGMSGSAGNNGSDTTNSPASKMLGGLYSLTQRVHSSTFGYTTGDGNSYNYMTLGKVNGNGSASVAVLTSVDAQAIDSKMDDGVPSMGKIFSYAVNTCTLGTTSTATYKLTTTGVLCTMAYRLFTTN